jgi:preprotein translocase subunit SecF
MITQAKRVLEAQNPSPITYTGVAYVGPQVGREVVVRSIWAVLLAWAAMWLYIWVRFGWQSATGSVVALVHDTVAMLGFYAITGLECNLATVAALLTVMGYSMNDSVVIYDRIRERAQTHPEESLLIRINHSVNQTLSRTLLTASATMLAVLALALGGGPSLHSFGWGMAFGVLVGTFSSIYVSATILIYFPVSAAKKETP